MSGFSPEWLALREPADHAARNPELLASVGGSFSGRSSVHVVDLGCGSGSNLRGAHAALPDRQHWTLVDHDPALLSAAREGLRAWADDSLEQGEELVLRKGGKRISVDFRAADLAREIESVLGWQPDLVTAAALFDLVSRPWLERVAAALVVQRIAFYTCLTYDGREGWSPRHEADPAILAAFNAHQRSDKGFGPAAGPDATDILAEAFRKSGYAVSTAPSPWQLDAAQGPLIAALADGVADAVRQTGRIDADTVSAWRAAKEGAESLVVGHLDLWARPV